MDVKERGDISRCSPIYLLNSCIGLLLIIAIIIGLCSPVYASRVVKVGLYENKPLIFTGKSGLPQGLFVDILDSIGHSEGWRIEYIPGSWVQCLKRLQNGEIDLMGSIAYSPERAKRYYFSEETVISNCGVFWCQHIHGKFVFTIHSSVDPRNDRNVKASEPEDSYAKEWRFYINYGNSYKGVISWLTMKTRWRDSHLYGPRRKDNASTLPPAMVKPRPSRIWPDRCMATITGRLCCTTLILGTTGRFRPMTQSSTAIPTTLVVSNSPHGVEKMNVIF